MIKILKHIKTLKEWLWILLFSLVLITGASLFRIRTTTIHA